MNKFVFIINFIAVCVFFHSWYLTGTVTTFATIMFLLNSFFTITSFNNILKEKRND